MKMRSQTLKMAGWVPAALVVLAGAAAAAPTGSLNFRTLTFADTPTAQIKFKVPGPVAGGTATSLVVEIAPDGSGTAPLTTEPLPSPQSVSFTLTLGAQTATFTAQDAQAATGVTVSTIPNKTVLASRSSSSKGLYIITITHGSTIPINTTEDWTLAVSGLPAVPPLRTAAFIDTGNFAAPLSPLGPCGTGTTCPPCNPCPPVFVCPKCWKYIEVVWPFPPLPEPCLSCPIPWKVPIPDGFERVVVAVTPFDKDQRMLGGGRADQVRVDIQGGEAIGGIVDQGNGMYVQMVQYRKGAPPQVSVTAAGITTPTIVAAPEGAGVPEIYRTLTFLLGILLVIAVLVIMASSRRRAPAAGDAPRA